MAQQDSKGLMALGLTVASTGVAHFIRPQLFEGLTRSIFPRDTVRHVYVNGGLETAIGAGLMSQRTRKAAVAGALGYFGYLGLSALRNR